MIALTVSPQKNKHKLIGFGTEWDPFIRRDFNKTIRPDSEVAEMTERRVRTIAPQRMRMMVQPQWYEPVDYQKEAVKTRFDFETGAVKALMWQLDIAEDMGSIVNLTFWCANAAEKSWLSYHDSFGWCSAPNDAQRYAENIVAFLDYIINQKKLTCVQDVTLYNEPSWAYYTGSTQEINLEHYENMTRAAHAALKESGLLDRVKLVTVEDAENYEWFVKGAERIGDISDYFSAHTYEFSLKNPNADIREHITKRIICAKNNNSDIPLMVDEFGTNNVIPPCKATDIYSYDRGLYLAKFIITALNAGMAGSSYWCMHDQNYSAGNLMETGLWGFEGDSFQIRPTYHSWGLINNYTAAGSEVYPIVSEEDDTVCAVLLKAPDGTASIIVCNLSEEDQNIVINNGVYPQKQYQTVCYSEATVTLLENLPASENFDSTDGTIKCTVPQKAFVIFKSV